MQLTGTTTKTKYYFLVLLGALFVAAGVLVMAPQAQSQPTPSRDCVDIFPGQVCLEKTATPTTVTVGEQITFTVRLKNEIPGSPLSFGGSVEDVVPPELRIDSVSQSVNPVGGAPTCTQNGNTVTCGPGTFFFPEGGEFILTIVATTTQAGNFVNTASSETFGLNVEAPFTVLPVQGQQPQGQQPQGGGSPAPITQEGEQESEAGEIDQSFDVS